MSLITEKILKEYLDNDVVNEILKFLDYTTPKTIQNKILLNRDLIANFEYNSRCMKGFDYNIYEDTLDSGMCWCDNCYSEYSEWYYGI
jgi:hypothetical protein